MFGPILLSILSALSPVHTGHTWWTGELSTVSFNAEPGDSINILMVPDFDAGHGRPPGSALDFLGMTAREAYETLTDRTSVIAETAYEIAAAR